MALFISMDALFYFRYPLYLLLISHYIILFIFSKWLFFIVFMMPLQKLYVSGFYDCTNLCDLCPLMETLVHFITSDLLGVFFFLFNILFLIGTPKHFSCLLHFFLLPLFRCLPLPPHLAFNFFHSQFHFLNFHSVLIKVILGFYCDF